MTLCECELPGIGRAAVGGAAALPAERGGGERE